MLINDCLKLLNNGLSIIPLKPRSKETITRLEGIPKSPRKPKQKFSHGSLGGPKMNVGVVTGAISNVIVSGSRRSRWDSLVRDFQGNKSGYFDFR